MGVPIDLTLHEKLRDFFYENGKISGGGGLVFGPFGAPAGAMKSSADGFVVIQAPFQPTNPKPCNPG